MNGKLFMRGRREIRLLRGRRRAGRRGVDREGEIRLLEGEEEGDVYVSNKPTSPSNKPISLSTCMLIIVHTAHNIQYTAHKACSITHCTQHTAHVTHNTHYTAHKVVHTAHCST